MSEKQTIYITLESEQLKDFKTGKIKRIEKTIEINNTPYTIIIQKGDE